MNPDHARETFTLSLLSELLETARDIRRDLDELRTKVDTYVIVQTGASQILTLAEELQDIITETGNRQAIRDSLPLWAEMRDSMAKRGGA